MNTRFITVLVGASFMFTAVHLDAKERRDAQTGPEKSRYERNNHNDRKHYDPRKPYRRVHVVRKPTYRVGHTLPSLPGSSINIGFRKDNFWFSLGTFFEPYHQGYRVIRAPVGLTLRQLPHGYRRLVIGGTTYFFLEGTYYLYDGRLNHYVVVEAPQVTQEPVRVNGGYVAGELYAELPVGAHAVEVNGIQYFKHGDLYFLPEVREGQLNYLAVKLD